MEVGKLFAQATQATNRRDAAAAGAVGKSSPRRDAERRDAEAASSYTHTRSGKIAEVVTTRTLLAEMGVKVDL